MQHLIPGLLDMYTGHRLMLLGGKRIPTDVIYHISALRHSVQRDTSQSVREVHVGEVGAVQSSKCQKLFAKASCCRM